MTIIRSQGEKSCLASLNDSSVILFKASKNT